MKKTDAIKHYGRAQEVAAAIGITYQAVHKWPKIVPLGSAYRLQADSRGRLKVNMDDYKR